MARVVNPAPAARQTRSTSQQPAEPSTRSRRAQGASSTAPADGDSITARTTQPRTRRTNRGQNEPLNPVEEEEEPAETAAAAARLAKTATTIMETTEPDFAEQLKIATEVPASPAQILEALPKLGQAALDLLFSARDIVDSTENGDADLTSSLSSIRNPNTVAGRMLNRNVNAVHDNLIAMAPFSGGDSFIRPLSIFQGLLNKDPVGPLENLYARLSDTIFMGNVATAARKLIMLDAVPANATVLPTLQSIEAGFPDHFVSFFSAGTPGPGSSVLLDLTFDFGLALRTQLVAQSWKRECADETFEPIDALDLYFRVNGDLKQWSFIFGRGDKYANALQARESQLRGLQHNGLVDFDTLETAFPWVSFQREGLSWASARSAELHASLNNHGGSQLLVANLSDAMNGRLLEQPPQHPDLQPQQLPAKKTGRPRKIQKKAGTSGAAAPNDFIQGLFNNPITEAQAIASVQAIHNIDPELRDDASVSRAPRRLRVTDPQETAERVQSIHFDDISEVLGSSVRQTGLPPTSSDLNVTQDAGLPRDDDASNYLTEQQQQQQQELAAVREYNNRQASEFPRQLIRKRRRGDGEEDEDDDYDSEDQPMTSNYNLVNAKAKEITAKVPKPTQIRVPWSATQRDMLIWLIEKHGPVYSKIAKEAEDNHGNCFAGRGSNSQLLQGALKDKARNIKFDYLKSGIALPKNFEKIPLNKIHREKLAQSGITIDHVQRRQIRQREVDAEDPGASS